MLDLILVYFKSVYLFFNEVEENLITECLNQGIKTTAGINTLIEKKISEIDSVNPLVKIFHLKSMIECENEENI